MLPHFLGNNLFRFQHCFWPVSRFWQTLVVNFMCFMMSREVERRQESPQRRLLCYRFRSHSQVWGSLRRVPPLLHIKILYIFQSTSSCLFLIVLYCNDSILTDAALFRIIFQFFFYLKYNS